MRCSSESITDAKSLQLAVTTTDFLSAPVIAVAYREIISNYLSPLCRAPPMDYPGYTTASGRRLKTVRYLYTSVSTLLRTK